MPCKEKRKLRRLKAHLNQDIIEARKGIKRDKLSIKRIDRMLRRKGR